MYFRSIFNTTFLFIKCQVSYLCLGFPEQKGNRFATIFSYRLLAKMRNAKILLPSVSRKNAKFLRNRKCKSNVKFREKECENSSKKRKLLNF